MKFAADFRHAAFEKMRGKWATLALITFIMALILGACSSSYTAFASDSFVYYCISGVGAIAALILGGPFELAQSTISLNAVRRKNVTVEMTFGGFKNFANAFFLYLVNAIFIFLWSLLFIVPGIIKELSYSMSFYILADNPELTQDQARAKSIEMMNGNKWRLFCLRFSFIGWFLLSIITCGILLFWVVPYVNCAEAEFYRDLIKESDVAPENTVGAAEKSPEEPFEEIK